MRRLGYLLAAATLAVSGAAIAAESLINGQALQYNHDYRCNGERINVGRCRDNDDSSYCQVYYPDRPLHNGMMVQPVEMRGDVVHKLAACTAPPQPQAAPRQTSTPVATAHAAAAPGLGHASWRFLERTSEAATFFTDAAVDRRVTGARGWFTTVFVKPENFPEMNLAGVEFLQGRRSANCADNGLALLQANWYDDKMKLLRTTTIPQPSFQHVTPGTPGGAMLNILCRRTQSLAYDEPVVGDGMYLAAMFSSLMTLGSHAKPGN